MDPSVRVPGGWILSIWMSRCKLTSRRALSGEVKGEMAPGAADVPNERGGGLVRCGVRGARSPAHGHLLAWSAACMVACLHDCLLVCYLCSARTFLFHSVHSAPVGISCIRLPPFFCFAASPFRRDPVCDPGLFALFQSMSLPVSLPFSFQSFHRLTAVHLPPRAPIRTARFSFSLLISHNCSLTPSLLLLSQRRPCRIHDGCGSETIRSQGQSPGGGSTLCQAPERLPDANNPIVTWTRVETGYSRSGCLA
jgi:hypothetical protein